MLFAFSLIFLPFLLAVPNVNLDALGAVLTAAYVAEDGRHLAPTSYFF